jgi:DNA-binding GntR family transcriptional regulator
MLDHLSLPDAVKQTLRRRILNAELPFGARLLETELAAEFDVSRTTVRQALRDLQAEGLVELTPRRQCRVARMSRQDARDVCFARYVLEASAAGEWLAWHGDDLDHDLEEEIAAMEKAAADGDMLGAVQADTRFHGLVVAAGRRPTVGKLWHSLDGQMGALMRVALDCQHLDLYDLVSRHRQLAQALSTRQPKVVEAAIREHYVEEPSELFSSAGAAAGAPGWGGP